MNAKGQKTCQPIRTGILGGSFNPAHGGHRRISLAALEALGLDEVWWLVSPGNPLKPVAGMAPLAKRVQSAQSQARRAPIRVSAIEAQWRTRYTVDTLRRIKHCYPKRRFVWLMGADNLAQFHRWREWRKIALTMPIAVIARPGYNRAVIASPAMIWLRHSARSARLNPWSAPCLVQLTFDPDPRSASALRRADPDWANRFSHSNPRDGLTHRLMPEHAFPQ